MKIRLMGSPEELAQMIEYIRKKYNIIDISRPYPCRDNPNNRRQYITVGV